MTGKKQGLISSHGQVDWNIITIIIIKKTGKKNWYQVAVKRIEFLYAICS